MLVLVDNKFISVQFLLVVLSVVLVSCDGSGASQTPIEPTLISTTEHSVVAGKQNITTLEFEHARNVNIMTGLGVEETNSDLFELDFNSENNTAQWRFKNPSEYNVTCGVDNICHLDVNVVGVDVTNQYNLKVIILPTESVIDEVDDEGVSDVDAQTDTTDDNVDSVTSVVDDGNLLVIEDPDDNDNSNDDSVTLEVESYAIGGTVFGLPEDQSRLVTIQNNNQDAITLTNSGYFTFSNSLNANTSYALSVTQFLDTQGDAVDGYCHIENSNGIVIADVADVQVQCKSWYYPSGLEETLNNDIEVQPETPVVAMSTMGNAIVAWRQQDETGYFGIYYSMYNPNQNLWTTASTAINPETGGSAEDPQVAIDDDGNIIIAWTQRNSHGVYHVYRSQYNQFSEQWSHPSAEDYLSPDAGHVGQNVVALAMDGLGNAIITWQQIDNLGVSRLFRSYYDSNESQWLDPNVTEYISPDTGGRIRRPHVAMSATGNAIIVWRQKDSEGIYRIYRSQYNNNDMQWYNPDASDYFSPNTNQPVYNPQVAMDAMGNVIVVWEQQAINCDGGDFCYLIYRSQYDVISDQWQDPETDQYINLNTGGSAEFPRLAMSATGNAMIVWEQQDQSNGIYRIYFSIYRSDNLQWQSTSVDEFVSLATSLHVGKPGYGTSAVAVSDSGNAVVLWLQQDSSGIDRVYKAEYRNGVWFKPESEANYFSITADTQSDLPQVVMNANDNAVAIWKQAQATTLNHIYHSLLQ